MPDILIFLLYVAVFSAVIFLAGVAYTMWVVRREKAAAHRERVLAQIATARKYNERFMQE